MKKKETKPMYKGSFNRTLGTLMGNLGLISSITAQDGKVTLEIDFGDQESAEGMAKTFVLANVEPQ